MPQLLLHDLPSLPLIMQAFQFLLKPICSIQLPDSVFRGVDVLPIQPCFLHRTADCLVDAVGENASADIWTFLLQLGQLTRKNVSADGKIFPYTKIYINKKGRISQNSVIQPFLFGAERGI